MASADKSFFMMWQVVLYITGALFPGVRTVRLGTAESHRCAGRAMQMDLGRLLANVYRRLSRLVV